MSFLDDIQKDIKENLKEGITIFKEGSSVFTEKIDKLAQGGKNKYKVFNLNMKVQEEFAQLGGEIYELIDNESKNPLVNRKVTSIINRINKLKAQINKLEGKEVKKPKKTTAKKRTTRKKTIATKKTAAKKKTTTKTKITKKTKTAVKTKTTETKLSEK